MQIRTILFLSTIFVPLVKYSNHCQDKQDRSTHHYLICDVGVKAYDFVSTFSFFYPAIKTSLANHYHHLDSRSVMLMAFGATKILVSELDMLKNTVQNYIFIPDYQSSATISDLVTNVAKHPIKESVILGCRLTFGDSFSEMFGCNLLGDLTQYPISDWNDPLTYSISKSVRCVIKTGIRIGEEALLPSIGLLSYYIFAPIRHFGDDAMEAVEGDLRLIGEEGLAVGNEF